jgi:hypothetical protein
MGANRQISSPLCFARGRIQRLHPTRHQRRRRSSHGACQLGLKLLLWRWSSTNDAMPTSVQLVLYPWPEPVVRKMPDLNPWWERWQVISLDPVSQKVRNYIHGGPIVASFARVDGSSISHQHSVRRRTRASSDATVVDRRCVMWETNLRRAVLVICNLRQCLSNCELLVILYEPRDK